MELLFWTIPRVQPFEAVLYLAHQVSKMGKVSLLRVSQYFDGSLPMAGQSKESVSESVLPLAVSLLELICIRGAL